MATHLSTHYEDFSKIDVPIDEFKEIKDLYFGTDRKSPSKMVSKLYTHHQEGGRVHCLLLHHGIALYGIFKDIYEVQKQFDGILRKINVKTNS